MPQLALLPAPKVTQEIELRPHQIGAKRELYSRIREGFKRIMVIAPCAWGKTYFAAAILRDAAVIKGKKCLFVVPFRTLVQQAIDSFNNMGLEVGVIAGGYPENREAGYFMV